jgi:hypothetical protein
MPHLSGIAKINKKSLMKKIKNLVSLGFAQGKFQIKKKKQPSES